MLIIGSTELRLPDSQHSVYTKNHIHSYSTQDTCSKRPQWHDWPKMGPTESLNTCMCGSDVIFIGNGNQVLTVYWKEEQCCVGIWACTLCNMKPFLHTHTTTSVITLWSSSQSVVKTSQTEEIFRHTLEMPGNTSLILRLYVCKLGKGEFKNKAEKASRENQQGELVEAVLG